MRSIWRSASVLAILSLAGVALASGPGKPIALNVKPKIAVPPVAAQLRLTRLPTFAGAAKRWAAARSTKARPGQSGGAQPATASAQPVNVTAASFAHAFAAKASPSGGSGSVAATTTGGAPPAPPAPALGATAKP